MPNEIYIFFPQNKLQEDFDMVQAMLEEKEKEIDMLTQELTQKHSDDESVVCIHIPVDILFFIFLMT